MPIVHAVPREPMPNPTSIEQLEHIADMVTCLESMASRAGYNQLAKILEVAAMEADRLQQENDASADFPNRGFSR